MNDFLQQYKDYYRVRAERFANNPNYKHSFDAESNLSNAMQSCNELIEFKDKIGDLNEKCAIALVKDEHIMEKAFYEKNQEDVRKLAANRILEKIDACSNAMEVASLVTEEMNKNSIEISMDENHREFQSRWNQLDEIEIYENAIVPDKYKAGFTESVNGMKNRIKEACEDSEKEARNWDPNYTMNPDANLEHRHRRLIPYQDEHLNEQLAKYKSIVNR